MLAQRNVLPDLAREAAARCGPGDAGWAARTPTRLADTTTRFSSIPFALIRASMFVGAAPGRSRVGERERHGGLVADNL